MLQVALVGCAHIHTPWFVNVLKERKDVQVKYVWDHCAPRAQVRARELGAAVAELATIWADKAVTAVVICSETNRHLDLVLPAVKAGKHLFVEKPLGMGAKDGHQMAAAIEKAGVIFQTGYGMRGDPKVIFIKQQIDAGRLGKITRVRSSNCHNGALGGWFDDKPEAPESNWRWMADPCVAGVGAFGDLGTHSLDAMMWFMGEVQSCTAQLDPGTGRYAGCDETGEGLLRFRNGAIGTLAAGWDDLANPASLVISGTEGHAAILNGELFFVCPKVKGADGKAPWTDLPASQPAGLVAFLDASAGKPVAGLVTAREAAARSSVMEALYQGAKTGQWVKPQ